ncbi:hypothetical protein [Pseudobacteriovorax antillogorgiicola]|uniref:Lipoprotein n=1 Tax=Pseudobacteriovorax antillogorgiicola TaxID=1513793 RepID=A0A1Y6CNI0_9BACT|nr:hypothetical protein [Pseudobacteriovorax antillogorgiicola]TCS44995.1 hypothetical protein EDD56_13032 [Pseudobacteriovorax antillogorgiicola]SMF76581.1 hypothetical protein SAMN06296036_13042 [Pseudobacteriovorax antillogorgiicola]
MRGICLVGLLIVWLSSCKKQVLGPVVEPGSSKLSSIMIGAPKVKVDGYDQATVSITCLNCANPKEEAESMVDHSIAFKEPKAFEELMLDLKKYRFTEGRYVTVRLKFFKAGELVLDTCSGGAQGCSDYPHKLVKHDDLDQFVITVVLQDLTGDLVETSGPAQDITIATEIIGSGNDLAKLPFTTSREQQDAKAGEKHCVADYQDGAHGGQQIDDQCVFAYGDTVVQQSEKLRYVKADPRFDLIWLAKSEASGKTPVVLGSEERGGVFYPMFLCRSADRLGKTSFKEDGSRQLWDQCYIAVDEAGTSLQTPALVTDFEILTFARL